MIDALLATHDTPEGLYGRRKMSALLRRRGLTVSRPTVDRPMRDLGLNGVRRGKKVRTTVPDPDAKPEDRPSDLLERDFTAAEPNQRWVADFTSSRGSSRAPGSPPAPPCLNQHPGRQQEGQGGQCVVGVPGDAAPHDAGVC